MYVNYEAEKITPRRHILTTRHVRYPSCSRLLHNVSTRLDLKKYDPKFICLDRLHFFKKKKKSRRLWWL